MPKKLEPGDTFAIITGKSLGKFITYIKDYGIYHQFLMMPGDWKILELTTKEYTKCFQTITTGNLSSKPLFEFIEKIPNNIFEVINEQYKYTKENSQSIIRGLESFT